MLAFFIRDGQVICDNRETKSETVAEDGFSQEVGNVKVTVHMDGGTRRRKASRRKRRPVVEPAPLPAIPVIYDEEFDTPQPAAPKPPTTTAATPTSASANSPCRLPVASLDDDDGFDLPMPMSPNPPPKAAPTPLPRPQPGPPKVPETKTPRDPNACPSCGRKIPGRAGVTLYDLRSDVLKT